MIHVIWVCVGVRVCEILLDSRLRHVFSSLATCRLQGLLAWPKPQVIRWLERGSVRDERVEMDAEHVLVLKDPKGQAKLFMICKYI